MRPFSVSISVATPVYRGVIYYVGRGLVTRLSVIFAANAVTAHISVTAEKGSHDHAEGRKP